MPRKDKEARSFYGKQYREKHREEMCERDRVYRQKHIEELKEKAKIRHGLNKERDNDRTRRNYKLSRERYLMYNRIYMAQKRAELKLEILQQYSKEDKPKCSLCDENDIHVLQIDHINGNGGKHRKALGVGAGYRFYLELRKQNYPEGFRVLCSNCNIKAYYGALNNKTSVIGEEV